MLALVLALAVGNGLGSLRDGDFSLSLKRPSRGLGELGALVDADDAVGGRGSDSASTASSRTRPSRCARRTA